MAAPKPNFSSSIWLIVAGLVVIGALGLFGGGNGGGGGSDVIPYSQFQQYLDANKVKEVTVAGNVIHGTLSEKMARFGLDRQRFVEADGPNSATKVEGLGGKLPKR